MLDRTRALGLALAVGAALMLAAGTARANGNVMVGGVTPGGDVNINGDSGNNDITVTQNPNGTVTVTGNNGTTVNGAASHTTGSAVTGKISINGRGGDDKIEVDGVKVEDLKIKDEIGDNDIDVKNSKISDKLTIENSDGSIDVADTSWGRREVDKGNGSLNPGNIQGNGGAGSVGTPPTSDGGDGAKTPSGGSKAPLNAQQGLPTKNPGQRGIVVPELPNTGGGYGSKGPKSVPKSKY